MNAKRILLTCAAVAVAVAAAIAPAQAATVKVGVVLTYSGGGAELGTQIDRGLELFIKENPDAFGGHTVELIKRDSKRPGGDIAKNAVQELVTREGVDILTGFVFSPNAIASAPLVTQAKVPMIVMNAGTAWNPESLPVHRSGVLHDVARVATRWGATLTTSSAARRRPPATPTTRRGRTASTPSGPASRRRAARSSRRFRWAARERCRTSPRSSSG